MSLMFPKPPRLRTERTQKKRKKYEIIAAVRKLVCKRDRRCRVCGGAFGVGENRPEMHEIQSRAELRGRPPEVIFSTVNCVLLHSRCHKGVTSRNIDIRPDDQALGADGVLQINYRTPKAALGGEMGTGKRVDTNHGEIVAALRQGGATVVSLAAIGRGVPDICIGYRDTNVLAEIKRPTGRLNPMQVTWHEAWKGRPPVILRTVDEALDLLRAIESHA